jgi:hypothetical protein
MFSHIFVSFHQKKSSIAGQGSDLQTLVKKETAVRSMSFIGEGEEKPKALWDGSAWSKLEKSKGKVMERMNSFIGSKSSRSNTVEGNGVVVIVDPFSTGAHLAVAVTEAGYKCAQVLSVWDSPIAGLVMSGMKNLEYCATIQHDDRKEDQDAATNEVS